MVIEEKLLCTFVNDEFSRTRILNVQCHLLSYILGVCTNCRKELVDKMKSGVVPGSFGDKLDKDNAVFEVP